MTSGQFCDALDEFISNTFNITDSNYLPDLYGYTEHDCDTYFIKLCIPEEWFDSEDEDAK